MPSGLGRRLSTTLRYGFFSNKHKSNLKKIISKYCSVLLEWVLPHSLESCFRVRLEKTER